LALWLTACRPQNTLMPTAAVRVTAPAPASKPLAGAAGLGDPLYPALGNGGYDVLHYAIDLTVDVASNTLTGATMISARSTQALSAFNLDFSGLTIGQVTVNDAPARYRRQNTELTITPAQPVQADSLLTVTVAYQGQPEPIRDPGVPFLPLGWQRFGDDIAVVSEPSGAMTWFPSNNHPLDKATFTMRLTVPKPYQAAANGILSDTQDNGSSTTYVWQMTEPMATYLATVHIGRYEVVTAAGPGGVARRDYFPLGTPASVKASFASIPQMMQFMRERIGSYPFAAYGVALLPIPTGWALETQTLSTFGAVPAGQAGWDEGEVMHELAHEWFGNSVSPATWQDVWLNEGFATYFQWLWQEQNEGSAAFNTTVQQVYASLLAHDVGAPLPQQPPGMFTEATYQRGAWTLHALRLVVGDEVFFKILRTYYQRFAGSHASTSDFIATAVEVSSQPAVETLLRDWLMNPKLPTPPALSEQPR
jgi:aminopeptidase N